ncbi:MAG TPA: hypothetical protein VF026_30185 [Ktedonobacteraceae bacterium]
MLVDDYQAWSFTVHDPAANATGEEGELADWFSKLEMLKYEEFMRYGDSYGGLHYDGLEGVIGRKLRGKG